MFVLSLRPQPLGKGADLSEPAPMKSDTNIIAHDQRWNTLRAGRKAGARMRNARRARNVAAMTTSWRLDEIVLRACEDRTLIASRLPILFRP